MIWIQPVRSKLFQNPPSLRRIGFTDLHIIRRRTKLLRLPQSDRSREANQSTSQEQVREATKVHRRSDRRETYLFAGAVAAGAVALGAAAGSALAGALVGGSAAGNAGRAGPVSVGKAPPRAACLCWYTLPK